MFNNDNEKTNGELRFVESIKNDVDIIFDVGCRSDSLFTSMDKIVHYFDPNDMFLNALSKLPNDNKESYFNDFGLSDEKGELVYYGNCHSFVDRTETCGIDNNTKILKIDTAETYINANNITSIDFLKIDTEGYELNVVKGFGEKIGIVNIIQFEYGGTFKDAGIKLIDMIDYLKSKGFSNFSYLNSTGTEPIVDFADHYNYCNIVCHRNDYNFTLK